jgi:hypothetical protein
VLEGLMLDGDDNNPAEARREQGALVGRSWAATAPLEEKVHFAEMLPSPQVEHDSRCAQMARALKQAFLDPQNQGPWSTLYPLLEGRGLMETAGDTETWLAGFVDGALDVMGLNPEG